MVTDPVRDNPDSVTQDAEPAQVPDSETTPTPIDQPAQDAAVPVTGESAEAGSATHTEAPAEAGGSVGPSPDSPAEAPDAATQASAAAASSSGSEPSEHDASEAQPKRKLQLKPTFSPEQVRAIPSVGGTGSPSASVDAVSSAPADAVEETVEQEAEQANEAQSQAPPPPAQPVTIPGQEDLEADLESQLAAAMSGAAAAPPPATVSAESEQEPSEPVTEENLAEGDSLTGQVLSIHGDDVFLVFQGFQRNGLLSLRQFGDRPPAVGQWIQTRVIKVDEENRLILVTLPRGLAKISGDWKAITKGQVVDCMVVKTNKGGLDVNIGTLRGFLPAGQVDLGFVADLETFVGQKLRVRITEVNPNRRRLVVSRRQILAEERELNEKDVYATIAPGQTVTGRVKTLKDYGAFVDIGGVDGLLHVAQISWQRVQHPSEVLKEGQEVEVQILSVDVEKKKIGLGMRQLQKNPWKDAEAEFAKGKTLTGKVTRTEAFGAFVEVAPGVEGLVHISELDHKRVGRVTDVVKVGDHVEAQVLEVDPKRKRISLSIKSLIAKPEPEKSETQEESKPGYVRQFKGDLKGGISEGSKGGLFGNPGDYH